VIGVQVTQADRVDLVEAGVLLERAERAITQVEYQPEVAGIDQVSCTAVEVSRC
jgi:hypothetical protein